MSPTDSLWLSTLSAGDRQELTTLPQAELLPTPDVLVVGAGIVGLATAYYLAEQGAKVQVIEAESIAAGASGTNAGGVWPNDQGPAHGPGFQDLAFMSRDLWGRLSLRPGFELDWRVNGFLNVNPERFRPSAAEVATTYQNQGYTVHAVDSEQVARLEPQLRPGLAAGLHYPSEAHLHPVKAALSFARAIRARGSRIACGVSAVAGTCEGNRLTAVETSGGRCTPRFVVSATGWTTAWMAPFAGALPPLRPVGGQLLASAPQPPVLKGTVAGDYLILQLRTGEIVTGGTLRESADLAPDPELTKKIAAAARDLIPALRHVEFNRVWCGLRSATPDGLPVIDRLPTVGNLFLASGHFRNGVLLAPATGKLLSEWIHQDTQPAELVPFGADRFPARA
ncbi:MAG: FAD-binding oxidoreductase [Planctomycetes bacterium]|nr:FAD-binding oxidoreductase [Planctomycetota bacterium]